MAAPHRDIGFMTLRRLRPLPPNTGSEADPGSVFTSKGIQELLAALRGSLGVLGYRAHVRLTEWTAYFASIACASHNWLSGQVTLPR